VQWVVGDVDGSGKSFGGAGEMCGVWMLFVWMLEA
jgi:hypothetical protein